MDKHKQREGSASFNTVVNNRTIVIGGLWTTGIIVGLLAINNQIMDGTLEQHSDMTLLYAAGDGIAIAIAFIAWFGFGNTWRAIVALFKSGTGNVAKAGTLFFLIIASALVTIRVTSWWLNEHGFFARAGSVTLVVSLSTMALLVSAAIGFIVALRPWYPPRGA